MNATTAPEQAALCGRLNQYLLEIDHSNALWMNVQFDHAQALAMNAQYDAGMAICADMAAEALARCSDTAKAMLTAGRSLMPELCEVDEDPSDDEIIDAYVEAFGGSRDAAAVRLAKFAMVPA